MRDTTGRVKIKGFYDTVVPLTETEIKALRAVPSFEDEIKENYGFSGQETNWETLLQAIQYPALNINGLHSGWVGTQQRTIVPSTATVAIDIRLGQGNDPRDMIQKVVAHIKEQGYHVVDQEPGHKTRMSYPLIAKVIAREDGYKAHRTPMDLPISQRVMQSLQKLKDRKFVFMPSLGGSLPIHMFYATLSVPIIGVSIVNHDNNQHQPDENLRISHLWNGIETYAAILMMESK
jgi:acetylornithine deacetylase/succinyl-diaminopimelate desuccinylase-like protein